MKRILVIEDDQWIRENTQELLELENYAVLTAADGWDGLEMAKRDLPDLILCDIALPLLNGFQVLAKIRDTPSTTAIPFVFLTASGEKKEVQKGLEMGANGYIIKPFTVEELLETIGQNAGR